jgi:hypothetical protein
VSPAGEKERGGELGHYGLARPEDGVGRRGREKEKRRREERGLGFSLFFFQNLFKPFQLFKLLKFELIFEL